MFYAKDDIVGRTEQANEALETMATIALDAKVPDGTTVESVSFRRIGGNRILMRARLTVERVEGGF